MTSHFSKAVAVVLAHEGGFVDDPADPGGATNFGISLRFAQPRGYAKTADDIKRLTFEQAVQIYHKEFWNKYGYGRFADEIVATKLLDACVNMGPGQAHRLAQKAAGATADGVLGPESVEKINACYPDTWVQDMGVLCAAFYRDLAKRRPEMKKFLKGWLKRAAWPRQG